METSFWLERWEKNQIGFHGRVPNPLLVRFFDALALPPGSRVFVPLCGKSLDIHWLLAQGQRVVGAELSEKAIVQLFEELGVAPTIEPLGELLHYHAEDIDIFVGDMFAISAEMLGDVDAIYDRAALVALPPEMRKRYTARLMQITQHAPQLLLTFEYDQSQRAGPPFSVRAEEVASHYAEAYDVELLLREEKSATSVEAAWHLQPLG